MAESLSYKDRSDGLNNIYQNKNSNDIKQLIDELAELLKQEEERDFLRRLPLYASRVTRLDMCAASVMTRHT